VGRSIVFASGKGGTGKTTAIANVGVALAQFGKEVIVIDADITMANLSLILGMEDIPITLHDVLSGEAELNDAIYEGPARGLEMTSITALLIGKELILVTNPEISAITDSLKTKLVAEKLGTLPLGAVLNRVTNEKTELSKEDIETILDVPVLMIIPEDPEVKRASAYGIPLVIKNPTSPAAIAYKQLAAKLAGIRYTPPRPERALFGGSRR